MAYTLLRGLTGDLALQPVEPRDGGLNGGGSRGSRLASMIQGLHRSAADLMQQLANFHFQPAAAFLRAIENVILHARAIDFEEAAQELAPIALDHAARPQESQKQVRQSAQG
jgi:hypothetical protein